MGTKLQINRLFLHLIIFLHLIKQVLISGLLLPRLLLSFFLLLPLITASCSLLPIPPIPETGTGEMLVQHGKYLYRIGGFDSDGNVQDTIYMSSAAINTDDTITVEPWTTVLPLPEGRAFGAAFSIGQYLYVIGGENDNGPVDTIYIAKIDSTDGTLGFHHIYGGAYYWVNHLTPLPTPRSRMGYAYDDGRIFLIGGNNTAGELDTIIHTRIQIVQSGKTGCWYTSPETLPEPRSNIGAGILNGRLYLLGGQTGNSLKDYVDSYALNPYGLLYDHFTEPNLPAPRGRLQIIADGNRLIAGSGYNFEGELSAYYWSLEPIGTKVSWNTLDETSVSTALSSARISGKLLLLGLNNTITTIDLDLKPRIPEVIPGSGYIRKKGTNASLWEIPDETTHLAVAPQLRGDEIGELVESEEFALETEYASTYTFTASRGEERSVEVIRNYYPLLLPSFFSKTLLIGSADAADYRTLTLTDTLLDGTVTQLEEALYRIPIYTTIEVKIDWLDAGDSVDGEAYTSLAEFTLFEEDYYTEVLDIEGNPVASSPVLFTGSGSIGHGNPATVRLYTGTYYLHITDTDESSGGTVGFSLSADTDGL
jgi:Kelch motif protein